MATKSKDSRTKQITQEKVGEVMHEFKHHQLRSGKSNLKVSNPKQAIAIGLSEARQAGAEVPPPPPGSASAEKAAASKKGARAKKSTGATKRTSAGKSSNAKRTPQKKTAARKKSAR